MKKYTTDELRQLFLDFFRAKGHTALPSASLVPHDDPTLLWINAGMAPLKPYFSGQQEPPNRRLASSQKCIRTNDIENVGKTARHHTLFEMLGNFSIGDYFKEESLSWGWEFLTQVVGLPADRLYATVHPDDDEARQIWLQVIKLPKEHVSDDTENFWDIGPGPCGPNSEIYFDQGPEFSCGSPTCQVGCDCDRYLEVWNHVFSQYDHQEDGSYPPLPNKSIDTGMSLERLAAVVQGVGSNFEIDLFSPIMAELSRITGHVYDRKGPQGQAFDIIADHMRAVALAIGDGAMPANEGRGYIIRRLLRRAVRFGRTLGQADPFLFQLVPAVVTAMSGGYPELKENAAFIERVVRIEEERFHETLDEGVRLLENELAGLKAQGQNVLPGQTAFRLYDTFGFPLDLTEDVAGEQGITVDRPGFEEAMAAQRERARAARSDVTGDFGRPGLFNKVAGGDVFIGYDYLETPARVLALVQGEELTEEAQGGEVGLLFDQTVFYAEAGGQVADLGYATADGLVIRFERIQKVAGDKILHQGKIEEGKVSVGQQLNLHVAPEHRQGVARAHSATHLLHQALVSALGSHVHQAGSLVENDRLRFDFSHFSPLSAGELQQVEEDVNRQILAGTAVVAEEMSLTAAREQGAMALFGEKYGERVRVVKMGDYSMELCGGTHVANVAMIGQVRLLGESGIGAGLRRVEALTGQAALDYAWQQEARLANLANLLKTNPADAARRLETVLAEMRVLERENETLLARRAAGEVDGIIARALSLNDITLVAAEVQAKDMDSLRQIADTVKDKLPSGVILLGAQSEGKANLVAMVSDDLTSRGLHAGRLIKEIASLCGGGGGGRPQMAQAGGKDGHKLPEALAQAAALVEKQLKS